MLQSVYIFKTNQSAIKNLTTARVKHQSFTAQSDLEKTQQTGAVIIDKKEEKKTSTAKIALTGAGLLAVLGTLYYAMRGKKVPEVVPTDNTKPQKVIEETFETFKSKCRFDKGKALFNDGTWFSGILTKETKDGGNIRLEFQNGVLQKSFKMKNKEKVFEKSYIINDKDEKIVEIIKKDKSETINLTEKRNIVKEQQNKLKALIDDNDDLSSEEFKKQVESIQYKNKQQNQKIRDIVDTKEYFELEEKELVNIKEKKEASDFSNEVWLAKQHKIKEKEYSEWWNKELDEKERPIRELRKKEIEKLKQQFAAEKSKFFEKHRNNLPSYEERCNEIIKVCRTEYGSTFVNEIEGAKKFVKEDDNYLGYLWNVSPKAKELKLQIALKEMMPDSLYMFNRAASVLDSKNLHYDKLDLAYLASTNKEILKSIAKGKFASHGGLVLGHSDAYTVNGALRYCAEVDDIIITILDEGFRAVEPLENQITVYRHVCGGKADNSIDFINKLVHAKKGDTFLDKGYSYSSFSPHGASSCNGIWDLNTPEIKMKIIVPKGAKVSNGSCYEQNELLFPRNAEFRIVEEAKKVSLGILDNSGKEFNPSDYREMVVEYILP